jgi:hypothetical protein
MEFKITYLGSREKCYGNFLSINKGRMLKTLIKAEQQASTATQREGAAAGRQG